MRNEEIVPTPQERLGDILENFVNEVDALTAIDVLVTFIMTDKQGVVQASDKPALDDLLHMLNAVARVQRTNTRYKIAS